MYDTMIEMNSLYMQEPELCGQVYTTPTFWHTGATSTCSDIGLSPWGGLFATGCILLLAIVLVLVTKKIRHKKITRLPLILQGLVLALIMLALSLIWAHYALGRA